MPRSEPLYSPDEAAEYLKISPKTVRKWLREGKLGGRKVGKIWRVRQDELDALVGSRGGLADLEDPSKHTLAEVALSPSGPADEELMECANEVLAAAYELLPRTNGQALPGDASRMLLPALFAKARADLDALVDLTVAGHTSGAAAVCRALFDTVVDFYYVTSGSDDDREERCSDYLALALIHEESYKLRKAALEAATKKGTTIDQDFPRYLREAASAVRGHLVPKARWKLVDQLTESVGKLLPMKKIPDYPDLPTRLGKTTARDPEYKNLLTLYLLYYPGLSGFAHGSAAVHFYREYGGGRTGSIGLSTGRLEVGHETPITVALIVFQAFLGRYAELCRCDAGEWISELSGRCHRAVFSFYGLDRPHD
jgi:excisionase family DNA binding protein